MDLWDNPEGRGSPFQVPADLGADKDQLQSHWPLTPRTGTEGGHDTEQALVRITERLGDDASAVVVLLTNSAASNSPFSGGRVIGADDPSYQDVLTRWDRLPQVSKSGASATLPFTVLTPGLGPEARFADAVVLLPRRFSGPVLQGGRPERLSAAAPAPPVAPGPATGGSPDDALSRLLPALLGFLLVVALVLVGLAVFRSGAFAWLQSPPLVLVVGSSDARRRFALGDFQPDDVICHLAGPGFVSEGGGEIVTRQDGPAGVRVASFHKGPRGSVTVRAAPDFECHHEGGASGDTLLKMGQHTLRFIGELPRPGFPPDRYSLEVEVDLAAEGA